MCVHARVCVCNINDHSNDNNDDGNNNNRNDNHTVNNSGDNYIDINSNNNDNNRVSLVSDQASGTLKHGSFAADSNYSGLATTTTIRATIFRIPFYHESLFFYHNVETEKVRNVEFALKHSALKILLRRWPRLIHLTYSEVLQMSDLKKAKWTLLSCTRPC